MEYLRRILPRQFADWRGKYLFEDEPGQPWRNCRVLDVSSAGAGLELQELSPGELVGTRILLAVHLRGDLRNAQPTSSGQLRAGIQFVNLTSGEREYLDSLAELQATW
jgi:hypothetical protein